MHEGDCEECALFNSSQLTAHAHSGKMHKPTKLNEELFFDRVCDPPEDLMW